MNGKLRLASLAFLSVFVLSLSLGPIHLVSALSPVSTLYFTPNATGPLTAGTSLVINMTGDQLGSSSTSGINGWDLVIQDNDPSAANLNPISISIAGSLLTTLGTVSEQINCVNGGAGFTLGQAGNIGCDIRDGPGIVHTAAVLQGPAGPTPISGLIAKITYTVNGAGEDLLNVPSPCPSTQGCDTLTDGTPTPVPHITRGADIQTPNNDFELTATNPPAVNPGSSASGTVNIASLNTYSAAITFTTDTFPGTGLTPACSAISPSPVAPGGTASATCTFNSNTPGVYVVTVNATDGTLFHLAPITVKVGDFTVAELPATVIIPTGNTGTATVTVGSLNGFAGSVAISRVIPATGLTATCPTPVNVPAGGSATSACSLSSSTPGVYTVTVTGTFSFTGGSITHQVSFTVDIADFTIVTTSTQPVVMASGATAATAQVKLSALFGWNKQVALTTTTNTTGLTAACGAALVPSPAGVLRTCTLTSTAPGAYRLTVTATCGTAQACAVAVVRSTTVDIRVQDISIQYSGVAQPITFTSGGSNSTTFTVSSLPANSAGFAGTANIATTINPLAGLSATCSTSVTLTAGGTSPQQTCTFNSSTPNTYTVTLNATALIATGQTVKHTITITVIVKPATVSHTTTTVISCHPTTMVVNNSTSCLIDVTDTSGTPTTPTGTVSFTSSGTGTFTACTLAGTGASVTCTVTYTPSVVGTGSHTLTAIYSGDSTHQGTQGTTIITVTVRTTTTSISCHPATIVVNNVTSCVVTITDTSPGTAVTPTGPVSLGSSGAGTFTTCTLGGTGAVATCSTTYSPTVIGTGSHTLTATYAATATQATSSGNAVITVTVRTTTTTVVCAPSPITVNTQTTCTVTVRDTSPGTLITPGGTVTVGSSGTGTFTGTCTLSGSAGTATCQVFYTPSGTAPRTDTITGTYPGDLTHSTSQGTFQLQVNAVAAHQTTTTISCHPTTVVVNNATSCTVTVTDVSTGPTTPTGTVSISTSGTGTFNQACILSGTGASAACSVTYTPTSVGTGSHLLTANYPGDAQTPAHSSSSGTATITVTVRVTTTTISCHPTTIVVNNVTSCTATITDTSPGTASSPTGTFTLTSSGTGTFSTCALSSSGASATCSVTYTPTVIGTGTHTLTATYGGDATHAGSANTANIMVQKRSTAASVSCLPSTAAINQTTTCTANVQDTSPGTFITPTGTVSFTSSATSSVFTGTCTLNGSTATATCTTSYVQKTTAGSTRITASYAGDTNHNAAAAATTTVSVTLRTTSTAISCAPNSVNVNQQTTCTATVTDTSPGTVSTSAGTVSFSSNSTGTFAPTSCTLTAGTCSVTFTAPATQGHPLITGNYAPSDTTHSASSGSFLLAVNTLHSTSTSLSCTPATVAVNVVTRCTATVTDTSTAGATTPTGTVTFSSSGTGTFSTTTCSLSGTGASATCTASVTYTPSVVGTGTHTITGTYGGDSVHNTSNGTFPLTVTLRATATTLACSPASVPIGQPSTCTATVADTSPAPTSTPTGMVTFTSTGGAGTFSSTNCSLSGGKCSVTFTPSTTTLSNISASYGGDAIHSGSATATAATVTGIQATFTISATSPASVPVGTTATSTITITGTSGFAGTVSLSDTPLPTGLTCQTLNPTSVTLPPSPATAMLSCNSATPAAYTVTITAVSGSLTHTTTATFTFSPTSQKDFTLTVSPARITLIEDSLGRAFVMLQSNGFNGTVNLSVKISPAGHGLTAHLVRIHVRLGPDSTQKILLIVSGDEANAGDYTVTVTGTSGSISHSASLKVTVTHPGHDEERSLGQFFQLFLLQVATSRWD